MKTLYLLLIACFAIAGTHVTQAADSKNKQNQLYDTKADRKEQIFKALAKAQKENKNVLLKFGANWCVWCHSLSDLFKENEEVAKVLNAHFVLVLIDVDKGHNQDVVEKYGSPTKFGLPVLMVLNAKGEPIHTQETGSLESGKRHSPDKVIEFLNRWKPSPITQPLQREVRK